MFDAIPDRLLVIPVIVAALSGSLYARGEAVDTALARVTIVVDGMMKSKSGAT